MLLDVRDRDEVEIEKIEGAINIPLSDLISGKMPDVSPDTPLKVFCASGGRASVAVSILREKGFINLENIGGIDDLKH